MLQQARWALNVRILKMIPQVARSAVKIYVFFFLLWVFLLSKSDLLPRLRGRTPINRYATPSCPSNKTHPKPNTHNASTMWRVLLSSADEFWARKQDTSVDPCWSWMLWGILKRAWGLWKRHQRGHLRCWWVHGSTLHPSKQHSEDIGHFLQWCSPTQRTHSVKSDKHFHLDRL